MTNDDKKLLKKQVEEILLMQGNQFIKELLRDNSLPIGATKKDFLNNIKKAIDEDYLTRVMIEEWLKEVEGWGNQHLYFYQALKTNPQQARLKLEQSEHAALIEQGFGYEFPDALFLTNIELSNRSRISIWRLVVWFIASSMEQMKRQNTERHQDTFDHSIKDIKRKNTYTAFS